MPRSFHNKILRVNLTEGSVRVEEPGQPGITILSPTEGSTLTSGETVLIEPGA